MQIAEQDEEMDDGQSDCEEHHEQPKDDSILKINAHSRDVFCLAVSPNKRWIASGSEDDTAAIWDFRQEIAALELHVRITLHSDSVHLLSWNATGDILASADMAGRIVCTPLPCNEIASLTIDDCLVEQQCIDELKDDDKSEGEHESEQLFWLLWHPSAVGILFAGCKDGSIWMWLIKRDDVGFNIHQSKVFTTNSPSSCCAGKLLSGSKYLLAAYENSTARVWNLRDASSTEIELPGTCSGAMDLNLNANLAAIGCQNGLSALISLNNTQNPKLLHTFQSAEPNNSNDSVETVRFAPNALPWLAIGTTAGLLNIYDWQKQSLRYECDHDGEVVVSCVWRFAHNTALVSIISACTDSGIRIWDAKNGEPLMLLSGAGDEIYDVCLIERVDGRAFIFSACANGSIRLFQIDEPESDLSKIETVDFG